MLLSSLLLYVTVSSINCCRLVLSETFEEMLKTPIEKLLKQGYHKVPYKAGIADPPAPPVIPTTPRADALRPNIVMFVIDDMGWANVSSH